jgi:toxin FitB
MYLLDTNVVSELRLAARGRAHPNVVAWVSRVDPSDLYISVITLFEIEWGVLLLERRDPRQGSVLRAWVDSHVIPTFAKRTLSIDAAIVMRCARLQVPDKRPERDAFIAATGLVHQMTIVTRDVTDFLSANVPVVNPWMSQP